MSAWRAAAKKAHDYVQVALAETSARSPSWIQLMMARAKLQEAQTAISESLAAIDALPTVQNASKHVTVSVKP